MGGKNNAKERFFVKIFRPEAWCFFSHKLLLAGEGRLTKNNIFRQYIYIYKTIYLDNIRTRSEHRNSENAEKSKLRERNTNTSRKALDPFPNNSIVTIAK